MIDLKPENRIRRDVFLFMKAKSNSPKSQFAQCITCKRYVPAEYLKNYDADLCADHGSFVPVGAMYTCGLYAIWPKGKPNEEVIKEHAKELDRGITGSVTPEESDLVDAQVRCMNCDFFDSVDDSCGLYEFLNKEHPKVFDLDTNVEKYDCCNANTSQ